MIYEELSLNELKEECAKRDLGTGRSKGELINRLYESDETPTGKYLEPQLPEPTVVDSTFSMIFEMYGRELDDELHMQLRMDTFMEAIRRGYEVPGGVYSAWRMSSEGGNHRYAVNIRCRDDS